MRRFTFDDRLGASDSDDLHFDGRGESVPR